MFTHPRFNIVHYVSDYYEFSTNLNEPGYPNPSNGAVVGCIGSMESDEYYELPSWAQQFPFGSKSLFTLPVGSDSLYLTSQGVFQHGAVTMEQSTEVSDDVIICIHTAYFKEEAFERANATSSARKLRMELVST
ncbi:hypothetical protein BDR03DRAFT_1017932 [Suillus americanus]|nr:hypothetical protein BDR03DRAFT_1017932 [Suillus americanus]